MVGRAPVQAELEAALQLLAEFLDKEGAQGWALEDLVSAFGGFPIVANGKGQTLAAQLGPH